MKPTASHLIYFSATGTTQTIARAIGGGMGLPMTEHSVLPEQPCDTTIKSNEIALFAVPVYSGRVPAVVAQQMKRFHGESTSAIIAVVYGNRDFDDALIELRDIVQSCGFSVISAGAFVAQHSIFPLVGHNRPNGLDLEIAKEFGKSSVENLASWAQISDLPLIEVRGNTAYRDVVSIPLHPKSSKRCNGCGICAKKCPVEAINPLSLRKTDKKRCISCARCIAGCPQKARKFDGLLYKIVAKKFAKKCSEPQSPYLVYK